MSLIFRKTKVKPIDVSIDANVADSTDNGCTASSCGNSKGIVLIPPLFLSLGKAGNKTATVW